MAKALKRERYSYISMASHWVIAALVLYNIVVGPGVFDLPPEARPPKLAPHATIGAAILILMVARLMWRLIDPPPAYPDDMPGFLRTGARISHFLFYKLVIAQPLFGVLTALFINYDVVVFGAVNVSGIAPDNKAISDSFHAAHSLIASLLLLLILVHILAGVAHLALRRDGVLSSMFPWGHKNAGDA